MKHIIATIIILASVLSAQGIDSCSTEYIRCNFITIHDLLEDYSAYEKECYEDSILVGYKYYEKKDKDGTGVYMNMYLSYGSQAYPDEASKIMKYVSYEEILEPREMPTFTGFMKFLRRESEIKDKLIISPYLDSLRTNKSIYETDGSDVEIYR